MFTKKFKSIKVEKIVSEINKNGYFSCEGALTKTFIEGIKSDIERNRLSLNNNKPGGTSLRSQYYNTFMLTFSKNFYDFCTQKKFLKVLENFICKDKFRLHALRYYETSGTHKMQWHTDTKDDKGFLKTKGLIFICYISDVFDGEFQYIRESHKISYETKKNDFSDDQIEKLFGKDNIVSFKGKSGFLVIYNMAGVHRAKPALDKKFLRKSLFFSVDDNDDTEPIYVKTSFLSDLDPQLHYYLGLGRKSELTEYPKSSINDLTTRDLIKSVLNPWIKRNFIYLLKLGFIEKLIPLKLKSKLKQMINL